MRFVVSMTFAGLGTHRRGQSRRCEQWAVDNSREKREAHRYTLEEFGLTEASIQRDFRGVSRALRARQLRVSGSARFRINRIRIARRLASVKMIEFAIEGFGTNHFFLTSGSASLEISISGDHGCTDTRAKGSGSRVPSQLRKRKTPAGGECDQARSADRSCAQDSRSRLSKLVRALGDRRSESKS